MNFSGLKLKTSPFKFRANAAIGTALRDAIFMSSGLSPCSRSGCVCTNAAILTSSEKPTPTLMPIAVTLSKNVDALKPSKRKRASPFACRSVTTSAPNSNPSSRVGSNVRRLNADLGRLQHREAAPRCRCVIGDRPRFHSWNPRLRSSDTGKFFAYLTDADWSRSTPCNIYFSGNNLLPIVDTSSNHVTNDITHCISASIRSSSCSTNRFFMTHDLISSCCIRSEKP